MIFKKCLIFWMLFACILLGGLRGSLFAQTDNRVPFKHRVGNPAPDNNLFRIRGDFALIGNTNLTLADYHDTTSNSMHQMTFVDIDKDSTTFNSSSATLLFSQENGVDPSCTAILYAGLYWSGRAEMDKGMTFDLTKGEMKGIPQEIDNEKQRLLSYEQVNYTSYSLEITVDFDQESNIYPIFTLRNGSELEQIKFRFTNSGDERVQYNIGEGEWQSVTNLKIATLGEISTATFDPILFSDKEIHFTIDNLSRSIHTQDADFLWDDNYLQVTTSGTHIPILPRTVNFDKRKVKLKGPGAIDYTEVTASGNSILFPYEELREMYVGYSDVTDYVKSSGMGEYTVANVALAEGRGDQTGFYGHWGLVVVYQNAKMHWRDVTVFDGYSFVQSLDLEEHVGEIEIKGFGAVKEGPVDLKLGLMAGEGDRGIDGDFLEIINQKGEWIPLHHPLNANTNFFNSSIHTPFRNEDGKLVDNPRNPQLLNNTGIDIVSWDIPNPDNSIIANEQTTTRFRFGTKQDVYGIYAFAFSVRSYLPDIQVLNQVESINHEIPGDEPRVEPGQEITYNLEVRNRGDEASEETRIVIPVPHTAIFVNAHTVPEAYGKVTFDPDLGLSGSIIWEIGEVGLLADPNELIASLQYTLKVTEDCFVLANDNCEANVAIEGMVSGIGSRSGSVFSNIPFKQGPIDGECPGEEIPSPSEIPITGRAEFAQKRCSGYELFSGLGNIRLPDFCQKDAPVDLLTLIPPSQEGFGVYFFTQETGGTPLYNYQVNTGLVGTEQVWVSEGPVGSCTGFRVPVLIKVLAKSSSPLTFDKLICNDSGLVNYNVNSTNGQQVIYYPDDQPTSKPLKIIPQVDTDLPGEYSVWVSQYMEGECESVRQEVKVIVEDCSLRPAIQVSIRPDLETFFAVGDKITYTIVVENIGGVPLINVNVSDFLTNGIWMLNILQPHEKKTFTTTYVISSYDFQNRIVTNYAYSNGHDEQNIYVNDDGFVSSISYTPGFLDYKILSSPISCGDEVGIINIEFQSGSQSGIYKLFRQEDGQEFSEYFYEQSSLKVEVPAGEYKLAIFDQGMYEHSIPGIYKVEESESVDFSVPQEVNACIQYSFAPEPTSTLNFKLKGPDGSLIIMNENHQYELTKTGTYSLTGMDPSGVRCLVEKSFLATINHPSELDLEVLPFCSEDVFTTIHLLNPTDNYLVNWYKIESQSKMHLSDFINHSVFTVQEDGEYEVTLTNGEGCLSGQGRIQVARSYTEPPLLNLLYTICPNQGMNDSITAGSDFMESLWYWEGQEISNSEVFVPKKEGLYSLLTKDRQGCEFIVDFRVEYKCEPTIRYPNAIMPLVPEKAFIIYPDNLTNSLEVFIQNRWGETIFHCEDKNIVYGKASTCIWDGTLQHANVPNGSYMVTIRYKTRVKEEYITEKSTLTVLN